MVKLPAGKLEIRNFIKHLTVKQRLTALVLVLSLFALPHLVLSVQQIQKYLSKASGNPVVTVYPGHQTTCAGQSSDITYTGTEQVHFTTCIKNFSQASNFYLYANKPISKKTDPNLPALYIYEEPLLPTSTANTTANTLHAQVIVSGTVPKYNGLQSATGNISTAVWGVGGFAAGSASNIYVNSQLPDTTNYALGQTQARWNISSYMVTPSGDLLLHWNYQILDIKMLKDEQFGSEYGIDKDLEFYYKTDGNQWASMGVKLSRDGQVASAGIPDIKDHTVYKGSAGQYSFVGMGYSTQKTYHQATFSLAKDASGKLVVSGLNTAAQILASDFDITNSASYCRLSAPHLISTGSGYEYYFTVFGKAGTNNCQTLGQQQIRKTSGTNLNQSLALGNSTQVLLDARDPYAIGNTMFYTDALVRKIAQRDLITGSSSDVVQEAYPLYPESPNKLSANGSQFLFYSGGQGFTRYLTQSNSAWNFQDYLSLPRRYRYVDSATGQGHFVASHWAGEFWHDNLGDPTTDNILTSFVSFECTDASTGNCTTGNLGLGFINFDIAGHPYLATHSLPIPDPFGPPPPPPITPTPTPTVPPGTLPGSPTPQPSTRPSPTPDGSGTPKPTRTPKPTQTPRGSDVFETSSN